MPDGDRLHMEVALRYQNVYKQVCEGYFDEEDLAFSALRMVKRDVKAQDDATLRYLQKIATHINEATLSPTSTAQWQTLYKVAETEARYLPASKRVKGILVRASKQAVSALENGATIPNVHKDLLARYMLTLYETNFADSVPLTAHHYNQVPHDIVQSRLAEMHPHVVKGIERMATFMAGRNTSKRMRLPPRPQRQPMGITTDVLAFLKRKEG